MITKFEIFEGKLGLVTFKQLDLIIGDCVTFYTPEVNKFAIIVVRNMSRDDIEIEYLLPEKEHKTDTYGINTMVAFDGKPTEILYAGYSFKQACKAYEIKLSTLRFDL